MAKKKDSGTGIGASNLRNMINKMVGSNIALDLRDQKDLDSINVTEWISTGSTLLDMSIKQSGCGGIPVGKISSIAGLPSTGKSYLAIQIARNAQEMGMTVIYFDSESAIDTSFIQRAGVDLDSFLYIRPDNLENVIEIIEETLKVTEDKILFIWDSLAFSEVKSELDSELKLSGAITAKPRLLGKAMNRILVPLARKGCTLLVLNQLRNRIPQGLDFTIKTNPYFTPGGNALKYAYSLEIWLTSRTSKAARMLDDSGNTVGAEVVSTIKKSRFGTPNRQATFFIQWGDYVGVADVESWFEALKIAGAPYFVKEGNKYLMQLSEDPVVWSDKFFQSEWMEKCKDPKFVERAREILEMTFANCVFEDIESELKLDVLEEDDVYEGE